MRKLSNSTRNRPKIIKQMEKFSNEDSCERYNIERAKFSKRSRKSIKWKMTISSHRKKERKRERSRARLVKQEAKKMATGNGRKSLRFNHVGDVCGKYREKLRERGERTR